MKKVSIILALVLAVSCICGCGGTKNKYDAEETTVFYNEEDGTVTQIVVEDFDEEQMSADELETFVDDTIASYTETNGEDSVTLSSLKVKDGVAKMKLIFASISDYAAFENCEFYAGTVSEASLAGFDFNDNFTSVSDGVMNSSEASGDTSSGDATHNVLGKVIVVSESGVVTTPGTIVYVSAAGTEMVDSSSVRVNMDEAVGDVVYVIYE